MLISYPQFNLQDARWQYRETIKKWIIFCTKLNFSAIIIAMPKRTYQPKKLKRQRKHGYKARAATSGGRKVIKRRRAQGRARLTI